MPSRPPSELRVTWRHAAFVIAGGVAGIVVTALVVKWAPGWLASTSGLSPADRAAELGRVRTALLAMLAGGIAVVGATYTARTLALNRQGQITERFTRAIDHIGHQKIDVRLGGIYALERIARESEVDHRPIMEILTAYLREHSPWPPREQDEAVAPAADGTQDQKRRNAGQRLATDIEAALSVVARRRLEFDGERPFSLSSVDLRGGDFHGTAMRGADLGVANLSRAKLAGVDLRGAFLFRVRLAEANLNEANLSAADLTEADLASARLTEANLEDTDLFQATLTNAALRGAFLRRANAIAADLTEASLAGADLTAADLCSAVLLRAELAGGDLSGARLVDAELSEADLTGADLTRVDLTRANLTDADLSGADLAGANLRWADLTRANLYGATYDAATSWPLGFDPQLNGAELVSV